MKDKQIKLTTEHFAIFKGEAEYWLDRFSLRNWEVYYGRIPDNDTGDAFANCTTDQISRNACLRLALYCHLTGEYDFPRDIHAAAFHEVCEVLLAELHKVSSLNRGLTDSTIHNVIRRLEHAVFRPGEITLKSRLAILNATNKAARRPPRSMRALEHFIKYATTTETEGNAT